MVQLIRPTTKPILAGAYKNDKAPQFIRPGTKTALTRRIHGAHQESSP